MTLRLAASPDEIAASARVRPSVRVGTAARRLEMDTSSVRRLLKRRELQGFRSGGDEGRGIRIYVDSIEAWQAKHDLHGDAPAAAAKRQRPRLDATFHEAMAYVKSQLRGHRLT